MTSGNIITILLVVGFGYMMFRGGCCGGHGGKHGGKMHDSNENKEEESMENEVD